MAPTKEKSKSFFDRMMKEYPNQFRSDGEVLYCLMCEQNVPATQKSQITQHVGSSKHTKAVNRKLNNVEPQKNQLLLTTMKQNSDEDRTAQKFAMDLTKCFIESNIPLHTIRNPSMVKFLETHTKYAVPSESTLRRRYVPKVYEECVQKLKEKAANKFIWVSLDESTDSEERYVVNFIFGVLDVESERDRSYLFTSKVLKTVNHSTMAQFFDECVLELGK